MADPNSLSFHEALEQLQTYGIAPPLGAMDVIASGGMEFPQISREEIENALREMDFGFTNSTSLSGQTFTNDVPSLGPSLCRTDGPLETEAAEDVQHHEKRTDARPRRQHKRTRKIAEHFETRVVTNGSSVKETYMCRQCSFVVTQKKTRERVFHLILCPKLPKSTRTGYYIACSDVGKPPLFDEPLPGLNANQARKLVDAQHENMLSRLNCLSLAFDPSRQPRFARYLLEKEKVKQSTPIGQCSKEESDVATDLLMEFIIEENIPFAVCDRNEHVPRPFGKLLDYLRPGYKMPLGHLVRGKLLDEYYSTLKKDMQFKLRSLMRECRGTIMFDGSEDVNSSPMVNILLRVMGSSRISTSNFFLTTVYTGCDTVDASYYVRMTEKVVEQFGGFHNIAGIVTDNTGSVKNAREALERKYPRLVASQDQAHVSDRLLGDLGEVEWIRDTLDKLSSISSALRRFRKLRARLLELMKVYNASLRNLETADNSASTRNGTGNRDGASRGTERGDPNSESESTQDVELCNFRLPRAVPLPQYVSATDGIEDETDEEETVEDIAVENVASSQEPSQRRTAVTMKKLSAVRFASSESLLEEYMRLHPVLLLLIEDPLFETLYSARGPVDRTKRDKTFTNPIQDEDFLVNVKQIHNIFRACRTYLRVFDSETSIASEVFEATRILKDTLHRMPLETFPEPRMENKQEILDIFENRMIGPLPGRKNIKISLLSDLHIAAALLDPYRTPSTTIPYMEAFNRHLVKYMSGIELSSLSIQETERESFYDETIHQYFAVRARWIEKGVMREHSESTANEGSDLRNLDRSRRARSPIAWWSTGSIAMPRDQFERKAAEELIEFAIRTLSVSPTATATERTFSLENRIHPKERASLVPEKVRKLLFCQWNSRVLRRSVQRDEIDIKWEIERQVEGMRKLRSVRAAIMSQTREETSPEASVRPTSTDQNTERVDNARERGVTTAHGSYIEGHITETQENTAPEPTLLSVRRTQLQQPTTTPNIPHPVSIPQLPSGFVAGSDRSQSWVSELFQAALKSALEIHAVRNQMAPNQGAAHNTSPETGGISFNSVPGTQNTSTAQDQQTRNQRQRDEGDLMTRGVQHESESAKKRLRRK